MSEEKITGLEFLKDIPKTNDLVSAYGSVNLEQLNNAIKRFKNIPNYDELLKENEKLQQENKQLKELYRKTCEHLFNIGNDELARYFQAQINECPTFTTQTLGGKE